MILNLVAVLLVIWGSGRIRSIKMHKVLFTGNTFSQQKIDELKTRGLEIIPAEMDLSNEELVKVLENSDGYILGGNEIATAEIISAVRNLKIIAFLSAGYEKYVDLEAATRAGIAVTYTPGANAYTVAEHTVALILDVVKQITYLNNITKGGEWPKRQAWNLKGKTLGIVGMGAVGSNVARIMHQGFDMPVLYVSRSIKPEIESELGAVMVELPELMTRSNVVSIHASYTDETKGMINQKMLRKMKSSAVLVNTSRAELVDGKALFEVLNSGKLLVAAFDNYYQEPTPSPKEDEYRLLTLPDDKFIITPHTAYSSQEAIEAMEKMIVKDLTDFFAGEEPVNLINPDYKSK